MQLMILAVQTSSKPYCRKDRKYSTRAIHHGLWPPLRACQPVHWTPPSEHISSSSRCHTSPSGCVGLERVQCFQALDVHSNDLDPSEGTPACAPHPANGVWYDCQIQPWTLLSNSTQRAIMRVGPRNPL